MIHAFLAILPLFSPVKDSMPRLDTARVKVVRQEFASTGGFSHQFKSPTSGLSLAQSLAASGVYLKQYGANGLATISIRGADPQQTQVLWNGIPVANPMLGMTDLNTFSAFGNDQVGLLTGNASSFYGSGNVGGAILVNNLIPDSNGIHAQIGFNPQQLYQGAIDGSKIIHKGYIRSITSWYGGNNQYVFRVPDEATQLKQIEKNAKVQSITQRVISGTQLGRFHLKGIGEYATNYRNLGTNIFSGNGNGQQWDRNLRLLAESKYKFDQFQWTSRAAFIRDEIRFLDTSARIHDTSSSRTVHLQTEFSGIIYNLKWLAGADMQSVNAFANAYGGMRKKIYPAQFVAFIWNKNRWLMTGNGRMEWHEKMMVYAFSAGYRLFNNFTINSAYRTTFRRPALNDLFWLNNGNTSLKSEAGKEVEFNVKYKQGNVKRSVEINAAFYHRILEHPIIWVPAGAQWQAVNYHLGKYKGLQLSTEIMQQLGKHQLRLLGYAEFTESNMQQNSGDPFHQRIFIPKLNGSATIAWHFQSWNLALTAQHTGKRFSTTDNSDFLHDFRVFHTNLSKSIFIFKVFTTLELNVQNLGGKSYYIMPGKPMPGRSIMCTIKIKI